MKDFKMRKGEFDKLKTEIINTIFNHTRFQCCETECINSKDDKFECKLQSVIIGSRLQEIHGHWCDSFKSKLTDDRLCKKDCIKHLSKLEDNTISDFCTIGKLDECNTSDPLFKYYTPF